MGLRAYIILLLSLLVLASAAQRTVAMANIACAPCLVGHPQGAGSIEVESYRTALPCQQADASQACLNGSCGAGLCTPALLSQAMADRRAAATPRLEPPVSLFSAPPPRLLYRPPKPA